MTFYKVMTLLFIFFFGVVTSHPPSGLEFVQTEEQSASKNPPLRSMDDKSISFVPPEAKPQIKEDILSNYNDQLLRVAET